MFEALKITSALEVNATLAVSHLLLAFFPLFFRLFFKGTLQDVVSFFYDHA